MQGHRQEETDKLKEIFQEMLTGDTMQHYEKKINKATKTLEIFVIA